MRNLHGAIPVLSLVLFVLNASAALSIEFSRDIRPIFNRHCVSCHGGVKQAGGLTFVFREPLIQPAKSGHTAIVPGDLAASELIRRITTSDPDDRMPPVEEHPEGLSVKEVTALKQWVSEGAAWSDHWSFVKPSRQTPPAVRNAAWCRTGIDPFILDRIERENLDPAPDESPARWLRRATLDLTGLPPAPEDLAAFLTDTQVRGEAAYDTAVDRLLGSPGFGERWASVWLDQVRYADSRGLGIDGRRNLWKYRDWVVTALNQDVPYDQFTLQQIAGDLLPQTSLDNIIATAGHRATQSNEEGGTDDEEFRVAAVLDRVNTVWQTWQGLTFGCVQCHHHPYDPIRHDEYYRFAAFFNNTADSDLDEDWPVLETPLDPDQYAQAARLDGEIHRLRNSLWRREYAIVRDPIRWRPLLRLELRASTATQLALQSHPDRDEFHTVDTVAKNTDITIEAPIPAELGQLTAFRVTGLPLNPDKAKADSEWGFVLSHVEAHLVMPGEAEAKPLPLARVVGDEPEPFFDPQESLNAKSDGGFGPYSRVHDPRAAVFILDHPEPIAAEARLRVELKHRVYLLGAFPLVTRRGHLSVSGDEALTVLNTDAALERDRQTLAAARQERTAIRSTPLPILRERPAAFARPTHVFIRGLFLTKDKEVTPNVPSALPPLPSEKTADRLALAHWLAHPDNPLTARVAVNRFWARLFGVGLVATEEDFGSSGDPPSHPELLDDLAVRFQHDWQWNVKRLLRELVLSRAYRQRAHIRPDLWERDPENRLLARGPRQRLPAEMVRDQALAIAGLLNVEMCGRPVHPPIPEGVWQPFDASDKWPSPKPGAPERYRRSIYTYTKRTIPYPMFAAFDAPSREVCAPRRQRSNTPIQALTTLNDETFAECARGLARRMHETAGTSWETKLSAGFQWATCVKPNSKRLAELVALFHNLVSHYQTHPEETKRLAESPEQAALQGVASVLLNLDEIMVK